MSKYKTEINSRERLQLWNWINEYVAACGGDTSNKTISNRRMKAVSKVEETIHELCCRIVTDGFPTAFKCDQDYLDIPKQPTIQQDLAANGKLKDALVDWMTRGNMEHTNTPSSRVPSIKEINLAQSQALADYVDAENTDILENIKE